jgi:hypothetical protein
MIFTISSLIVLAGCIGEDVCPWRAVVEGEGGWPVTGAGFGGGEGDGGCAIGIEAASRSHARFRIRI